MQISTRLLAVMIAFGGVSCLVSPSPAGERSNDDQSTEGQSHVLLITIDGLRWQEVFGGADESLLNRDSGGVRNVELTRDEFWRETDGERRRELMPFLWGTVAAQGRLIGHPDYPPLMAVTNGLYFSYPGYNELLTGYVDPRIDSNAKRPNPNVTVLEWLNQQEDLHGGVAAVTGWDVFPYIINSERSGIPVNSGWEIPDLDGYEPESSIRMAYQELPRVWDNVRYDWLTFEAARAVMRHRRPRVMYVAFGETDDWAHEGRYDLYLNAARRTDEYIRLLWNEMQALPGAKGHTTLIITTDHGRGDSLTGWKNHGKDLAGSDQIWAAVLGPHVNRDVDVPAKLSQSQIAASVAAALGKDYTALDERIAAPFPLIGSSAAVPE